MPPAGTHNALTDVPGGLAGHETVLAEPGIRTGVTASVPHAGNLFEDRVPPGVVVSNGFGKFAGLTQVQELGELETPGPLTSPLSVAPVVQHVAGRQPLHSWGSHPEHARTGGSGALHGQTRGTQPPGAVRPVQHPGAAVPGPPAQ
ncbi:hypothetical protein GCM10010840_35100 [Deinococcus aerolatus]|uniref:Uncharacterized protein n=1 Tax=Deinococcus aerolatus TaxID=522487 RepID=A0ABQ2GGG9_9DEIO|nr:P1 family peptidase [Deinococcus aerolatus]GGL94047.1 hypothetical protein GCM10010840_35100 [Deinococcus aerolatus]